MRQPDNQTIEACRAGDGAAIESLIASTREPLYRFISAMVGGHADADEIFQEVWLRALRRLNEYRNERFLSWLFRIARNLVIDRVRANRRMLPLSDAESEDRSTLPSLVADAPHPLQTLAAEELRQSLKEALSRLPPEQREVFLLRTEAELPFKEIARLQGVSINTALARMQYAVRKLRYYLGDQA